MYRRTLLAAGVVSLLPVAGCLDDDLDPPEPDSGDDIEYDERTIVANYDWLATHSPPATPRLVVLRTREDVASLVDPDRFRPDDPRSFVEDTDYESSTLLVVEFSLTAGFAFEVTDVSRRPDGTVRVHCQESDEREPGEAYPAVDELYQVLLRIHDDGTPPETVDGRFLPAGEEDVVEIEEHVPDTDGNEDDEADRLDHPRPLVVENESDTDREIDIEVSYDGAAVVDETVVVEAGSEVRIEDVADTVGTYTVLAAMDDVTPERYQWDVTEETVAAVVIVNADGDLWITEDVA